eukprot:TRINITY_DN6397_c0_g1_i10.p1 TRINITY_DN6397_c0_g1~~TRINITY_DN6397_c0_g1_i10.p1  ORF type:complete len:1265 (-),score=336.19 TRINITY_DN6397_c0_g1_i10:364-4158(-)
MNFLPLFFLFSFPFFDVVSSLSKSLDPSSDLIQELSDALESGETRIDFELQSGVYSSLQSNSSIPFSLSSQVTISIHSNWYSVVKIPFSFEGDSSSLIAFRGIVFEELSFKSSYLININGPSLNLTDCLLNLTSKSSLNVSNSHWIWINNTKFTDQGNLMRIKDVDVIQFYSSTFVDIKKEPDKEKPLNLAIVSGRGSRLEVEGCIFTNISYVFNREETFHSLFFLNGTFEEARFDNNLMTDLNIISVVPVSQFSYISVIRLDGNFTSLGIEKNQIYSIHMDAVFLITALKGNHISVRENNMRDTRGSLLSFTKERENIPYILDTLELRDNTFINITGSIMEGETSFRFNDKIGAFIMRNTNCIECKPKEEEDSKRGVIIQILITQRQSVIMDSVFVNCVRVVIALTDLLFFNVSFDGNQEGTAGTQFFLISFVNGNRADIRLEFQNCSFINLTGRISAIISPRPFPLKSRYLLINNSLVQNSVVEYFCSAINFDNLTVTNLKWYNNRGKCLNSMAEKTFVKDSHFYNSSDIVLPSRGASIISVSSCYLDNLDFDGCGTLVSTFFESEVEMNGVTVKNQKGVGMMLRGKSNLTISDSSFHINDSIAFAFEQGQWFTMTNSFVYNANAAFVSLSRISEDFSCVRPLTLMMDNSSLYELLIETEDSCFVSVQLNRTKVDQPLHLPESIFNVEIENTQFKGGIPYDFLLGKPYLERIHLQDLSIDEMQMDTEEKLVEMNVLNCSLRSVKGRLNLPNLEILSLRNNQLKELDANLFNSTKITSMDISNNKISGTLTSMIGMEKELDYLDVSNNLFDSYNSSVARDITVCRTFGNVFRCPVDALFFERCNVTCLWSDNAASFYLVTLNSTDQVLSALSNISNARMDRFKVLDDTLNHFVVNPPHLMENEAISSDVVASIASKSYTEWKSFGIEFISFSLTDVDSRSSSSLIDSSVKQTIPFIVVLGVVLICVAIIIIGLLVAFLVVSYRSKRRKQEVIHSLEMEKMAMVENVVMGKKIGSGFFGEVFIGVWNETTQVAVKKINKDEKSLWEAQILRELNHPNIVDFYGMHQLDDELYIIMEYCSLGSLDHWIAKQSECSSVTSALLLNISIDIAKGMQYLASQGIIHRDLSARNVLVADKGGRYTMRVTDFGMSRKTDEYTHDPETAVLPFKWVAPEVMMTNKWTQYSDVWSFGICLWELYSLGTPPYDNLTNKEAVSIILEKGCALEQPSECPNNVWKIMQNCWSMDPTLRPTFDSIVFKLGNIQIGS